MNSYLEYLADRVGRLSTGLAIVGVAAGWILLNVALAAEGFEPVERFPFHWLQRVVLAGNLVILFLVAKVQRERRARTIGRIAKVVAAPSMNSSRRRGRTEH